MGKNPQDGRLYRNEKENVRRRRRAYRPISSDCNSTNEESGLTDNDGHIRRCLQVEIGLGPAEIRRVIVGRPLVRRSSSSFTVYLTGRIAHQDLTRTDDSTVMMDSFR